MSKKLFILFIISFFVFFSSPVHADYASQREEYSQKLESHNKALSDFKIAKNTYETYKTLSSQSDAIFKAKDYLQKRDDLVIKHFELLLEKIKLIDFADPNKKESLNQIASSEINFFSNHLQLVSSIATTGDVNTVSKKAEDEIALANIKSKQILGGILIAKVNILKKTYNLTLFALTNEIADIKSHALKSQDSINKLERWIVEINNKKILSENNMASSANDLDALNKNNNNMNLEKKFDEIRINIIQGHLYLKEGTAFMGEALNEIKYD